MLVSRPNLIAIICLGLMFSVVTPGWARQKKSARKAVQKTDPAPEQTTPPPPPTPQTLAQMPAVPPQVTFQNGQLTIVAQNSTLSDILHAVHRQTGAEFDMPPNATERVVTQLGPGPAREVLASLLNGSHFDYVMVGSPNNPSALDHVILMARNESATANQPTPQPPQPPQAAPAPEDNAEAQPDDFGDDNAEDTQIVDQAQQQQQNDDQQQADQQQPLVPGQPGVKTPEQLLQELQQRQQQQQQQGGAPTPAAPQGFPIPPGQQPNPNAPQPPQ